ncbi:MAG TPA: hypothetical protein VFU01_12945 [Gemmatimonadaceae bacterium]|nr:hypothetical protein [Gemmatimonadaceae bacterium]
MRTTQVLRAAGLLLALVACQPRDDSAEDSMRADSTPTDDLTPDSAAAESADTSTSAAKASRPPRSARGGDTARDSKLPPEDSIRAMRPRMPEVLPDSRPGRWRGFKLPEERPVQLPIEKMPDSVMKGDSTRRPPLGR